MSAMVTPHTQVQYVFFGPPGSGKAQLVQAALAHGIAAVDVAAMGDSQVLRVRAYQTLIAPFPYQVVGGADLDVLVCRIAATRTSHFRKRAVLLLPPRDHYIETALQKRRGLGHSEHVLDKARSDVTAIIDYFGNDTDRYDIVITSWGRKAEDILFALGVLK
jgi:hypothetical protein